MLVEESMKTIFVIFVAETMKVIDKYFSTKIMSLRHGPLKIKSHERSQRRTSNFTPDFFLSDSDFMKILGN